MPLFSQRPQPPVPLFACRLTYSRTMQRKPLYTAPWNATGPGTVRRSFYAYFRGDFFSSIILTYPACTRVTGNHVHFCNDLARPMSRIRGTTACPTTAGACYVLFKNNYLPILGGNPLTISLSPLHQLLSPSLPLPQPPLPFPLPFPRHSRAGGNPESSFSQASTFTGLCTQSFHLFRRFQGLSPCRA